MLVDLMRWTRAVLRTASIELSTQRSDLVRLSSAMDCTTTSRRKLGSWHLLLPDKDILPSHLTSLSALIRHDESAAREAGARAISESLLHEDI